MQSNGIDKNFLRQQCFKALRGVGDASLGEWEEWNGQTYQLKRRLTEEEQSIIGCPIDIRGTQEALERYNKVKEHIPSEWRFGVV